MRTQVSSVRVRQVALKNETRRWNQIWEKKAGKNGPGYMLAYPNIHLVCDLLEHGRVEV